jgi:hypothetical protein
MKDLADLDSESFLSKQISGACFLRDEPVHVPGPSGKLSETYILLLDKNY